MILKTNDDIERYRLATLLSGLKLEMNTGMTLSRGRSCYSIIKEEFNLKGNKKRVYEQFKELLKGSK